MGVCQAAVENRSGKITYLRKKYPLYHETSSLLKDNSAKYIIENENELWEHYTKFTEYKEELLKLNPSLHQQLFDPKIIEQRPDTLEVESIRSDLEEKFFFFFNKRRFKELTIKNSHMTFPRICFQLYPRFKEDKSTLTSLIISNSNIRMDEQTNYYPLLEDIEVLEISFCNIGVLPEGFGLIKNVKNLCLRRNQLKSLPQSFDSLRELEFLDLSENDFTTMPKEIFYHGYKLLTLNMCGNQLESFEFIATAENYLLEHLFLSRNKLTKIPYEIRKLKNIKYVNLDENLINERLHNLNEEIPLNIKLSCLKNKGINEVIELMKPDAIKPKVEEPTERSRRNSIVKEQLLRDNKSNNSSALAIPINNVTDISQNISSLLEPMRIKQTHTELEADIAKFLDKLIDQIISDGDLRDIESEKQIIKEEQYIFMMEKLESLISIGREKEIGLIENFTLKDLFKQCYLTYIKVQEFNNNGELPCTLEEMHPLEKNYFIKKIFKFRTTTQLNQELNGKLQEIKQNNKIKKREDVSNLIFLKELNQMIASSKVKLFLHYLGNIDRQINEYFIALWNTVDNNSFILLLTEMKLLLRQMLDYYEEKYCEGLFNIRYEIILSEAKTVIHE